MRNYGRRGSRIHRWERCTLQVICASAATMLRFGLAAVSPPPYMENFPKRHPILYKLLAGADARISNWPPFNSWADHFILTVQYLSEYRT